MIYKLARPQVFLNWLSLILPVAVTFMILFFALGLYMGLVSSPTDYQQGDTMRIMYVHVPASWMALFVYVFLAGMSVCVLVWRHPLAEILALSSAPIGALFTVLSLITGSLWGKPMWGAYWVWDARLTSVLILLFLYAGYWALYKSYSRPDKGVRVASILAIAGAINIPIIKGSVVWWNTLHQPASLTKLSSPSIHMSMLIPLLLMAGAYFSYFIVALILRTRLELNLRKQIVREMSV